MPLPNIADCEDFLWLIFCRLPLLALVRCRTVVKRWNSYITGSQFPTEYFQSPLRPTRPQCVGYFLYPTRTAFAQRRKLVRFYGGDSGVSETQMIAGYQAASACFPVSERCFVCSSNGVLLCYSIVGTLRRRRSRYSGVTTMPGVRYFVCNPMTKEWLELRGTLGQDVAAVGFHCPEPPPGGGTRYEFEIVRVFLMADEDGFSIPQKSMVNIYSSKTESWSGIGTPLRIRWNHQKYVSIVIGGVFYFLDDQGNFFLYDPVRECLEEGPVPPDEEQRIREKHVWLSIHESDDGELVLYVGDDERFRVWVRADADADDDIPPEWQVKHQAVFADLAKQCPYAGIKKRFLEQPRAVQMPGCPGKAIVGTAGRQVYLYDFGSEEMQLPSEGQADCFGKMYNYYYCPYHVPTWYYSLSG